SPTAPPLVSPSFPTRRSSDLGFVGEFLVLLGTFEANKPRAIVAAVGVILSAVYMLWLYQRVIWGEVTNDKNRALPDLFSREKVRSEEHTSELQSRFDLVCRLL